MATAGEIGKWLYERVQEIENRNGDAANPASEDVRHLAVAVKRALVAAEQIQGRSPNYAEALVRQMASSFSDHDGYEFDWAPTFRENQ
jgi:hypothetical protein